MSRLIWDQVDRRFEVGVDRGVIFPKSGPGVPWSGLIRVDEIVKAVTPEIYFMDGKPIGRSVPVEDFSAVVEAFYYPDILDTDHIFDFSYRSDFDSGGRYLLNLIYNATFQIPDKSYATNTLLVDPTNFVWNLETTPREVKRLRPFSHLIIDTLTFHPLQIQAIENELYGTLSTPPSMPSPEWIMELLGTWTFGYGHGPYGQLPYGGHTS